MKKLIFASLISMFAIAANAAPSVVMLEGLVVQSTPGDVAFIFIEKDNPSVSCLITKVDNEANVMCAPTEILGQAIDNVIKKEGKK